MDHGRAGVGVTLADFCVLVKQKMFPMANKVRFQLINAPETPHPGLAILAS